MPNVRLYRLISKHHADTGRTELRPLKAIKAVRAATGLGLRETKDVVDRINPESRAYTGISQVIRVPEPLWTQDLLRGMTEAGLMFEVEPAGSMPSQRQVVLEYLDKLPGHLTVSELRSILGALKD